LGPKVQGSDEQGSNAVGGSLMRKNLSKKQMTLDEALLEQQEYEERIIKEYEPEREEIQEGLTIEACHLKNAWARYRPDPEKPRDAEGVTYDIKGIFTDSFITYLMANIHLKVYDYIESEEQITRKKEFKKFITEYKDKVKDKEQKDKQQKEKDPDSFKEEPDPTEGVPDEELELIDKFLTGFML